jgi:hypothetical protein
MKHLHRVEFGARSHSLRGAVCKIAAEVARG